MSFRRGAPGNPTIISDAALCSNSNGFYPLTIVAQQFIFDIYVCTGYASNQVKLLFNLLFNCRNVSEFSCGRDFSKKMPHQLIRICQQSKLDQEGAENVILQIHILSDAHFAWYTFQLITFCPYSGKNVETYYWLGQPKRFCKIIPADVLKILTRNLPAGNCMFKVNNRNVRKRYEICSKLTINIPERR